MCFERVANSFGNHAPCSSGLKMIRSRWYPTQSSLLPSPAVFDPETFDIQHYESDLRANGIIDEFQYASQAEETQGRGFERRL